MDKYTIEVKKLGEHWYADMHDAKDKLIATGVGKTGPLDAASNAAIHASNVEYDRLRDDGT